MEGKTSSPYWKIVLTLGLWMVVLTVVQGLGLYYLLSRYTAARISVQTNIINRQTDRLIEEMKNFPSLEEVKNIKENLEKIDKEMGTKIENMERDILKDLSPNLKITSQKPYFTTANQVKFIYAIQNKGRYAAYIQNVKLLLATSKIESPDRIKNQLTVNKDYSVKFNTNTEDIAPGEEIKRDVTIDFPDSQKVPGTMYYCVTFEAQTDPNIIKSVKTVDQDKIINKKPYYILGDIITPG
jgi:hypothetical protein